MGKLSLTAVEARARTTAKHSIQRQQQKNPLKVINFLVARAPSHTKRAEGGKWALAREEHDSQVKTIES